MYLGHVLLEGGVDNSRAQSPLELDGETGGCVGLFRSIGLPWAKIDHHARVVDL